MSNIEKLGEMDLATQVLFGMSTGIKTDTSTGRRSGKSTKDLDKYKKENKGKDLNREWTYQEVWDEVLHSGNVLPKTIKEGVRIVCFDADTLAYRVSSSCETRSVHTSIKGEKIDFPTRTKLKEYCKKMGVDYRSLDLVDKHVNKTLAICYSRLNEKIYDICKELKATHVVFFLGGSENFRSDLPLPTLYKGKRIDNRRPDYLKQCRDYLNKHYNTFIIKGCEADDVVQGMTGYLINETPAYAIAVNQDKDFHTSLVKNRYYHIVDKKIIELDGGLGKIYMKANKVKGDGLHWLLAQTMLGDYDDDFSPKQFFKKPYLKNYGDTKYYEDFKDYDNEKDLLLAWVKKWKELLPEVIEFTTWDGQEVSHSPMSLANLYFSCPFMLTHPKDATSFTSLLIRYGVWNLIYNAENKQLITANNKEIISE